MIDIDRVRTFRAARLFSVVMASLCIGGVACPWAPMAYTLLALFGVCFVVRAIEYSAKLHEIRLYADDLPVRERRRIDL